MIEFEKLRDEIIFSDKMSLNILGYSFAVSAGILSVNKDLELSTYVLLLLVQALWIMSFFYISNRRFAIHTIATYIKEKIEAVNPELNWETWLRETDMPKSLRIYYVETIICSIPITGIFIFYLYEWLYFSKEHGMYAQFKISAIFSVIMFVAFIVFMRITVKKYNLLRSKSI